MSQTPLPQLIRTPSMSRGLSSTPQPNGIGLGVALPAAPTPAVADLPKPDWNRQNHLTTNYATRIKTNLQTALVTPIVQVQTSTLPPRSARRGQTTVNYAEDDDDDFDDKDKNRGGQSNQQTLVPEEIDRPIEVPGKPVHVPPSWIRPAGQKDGAAELPRVVVPIFLELNLGDRKVRDQIIWNIDDGHTTFEQFAITLCRDLELDAKKYLEEIITTMRNTLSEWGPVAIFPFGEPFKHPLTGAENKYLTVINIDYYLKEEHVKDRFEWNIFGNDVSVEQFVKQTCADAGLYGEHLPTMTAYVYQGILQAKRELIEAISQGTIPPEIPTEQHPLHPAWRYNQENLGADWGLSLEKLSREEMEKKESDRDRAARRARRETARVAPATPGGYFSFSTPVGETPGGAPGTPSYAESLWRRKQRRPIRDRSPIGGSKSGNSSNLPIPIPDSQLVSWRCSHCALTAINVWGVVDGPDAKNSLCAVCGYIYSKAGELPPWRAQMFATR